MNGLVEVYLHGPLADTYGARHAFAIRSTREAVAALDANYPGFRNDFLKHGRYVVIADGEPIEDSEQGATFPVQNEVHFCPQIEGGAFIGAAIVGAIFPSLLGVTIFGVAATTILGGLLFAGLMLGVSLLLSPKALDEPEAADAKDENFAFSGPENLAYQGATVPLIYGRVFAGSVVISAGLELGTVTEAFNASTTLTSPRSTPSTDVEPGLPEYPGGWPAIVIGIDGYWQPLDWVLSQTIIESVRSEQESEATLESRLVRIFTPGINPVDGTFYAYNETRGFYALPAGYTPQADEWLVEVEA